MNGLELSRNVRLGGRGFHGFVDHPEDEREERDAVALVAAFLECVGSTRSGIMGKALDRDAGGGEGSRTPVREAVHAGRYMLSHSFNLTCDDAE